MGQCLRGKMVEVGLIPAPPAPAVAETEAPADEIVASVEEAVPAEPALDVTPPAEPEAEAEADLDQVVAATFGLLRAEPDGSVVIAGSGAPGSRVEVFANGELLGTVEVETSGDWVFVPDTPLPPGGLEITLGEEGKAGTAEGSFIVVINEDKTSQPLVVASTPGEASEVLQGLTPPVTVAAAPEMSTSAPVEQPASPEAPAVAATPETTPMPEPSAAMTSAAEAGAEPDASPAPAENMQVASAPEPATPSTSETVPAAAPADPEAEANLTQPEAPADVTAPATAATTQAPETAESSEAVPAAAPVEPQPAVEPAPEVTAAPAAEPVPAELPEQPTETPPTIDAIEIENDRTFFAGAGPEGGIVRLYVDDEFVADATIESGRWLIEAGPVLDAPSQRVRVDLLGQDSADVVARAEVDFVVDVPAVEEPLAVAEAPAAVASEATAPAEAPAEPASGQPASTQPAAPDSAVAPEPPAAPAEAPATASSPTAEPGEEPVSSVTEQVPDAEPAPVEPVPETVAEPAAVPEAAPAPAAEPEEPAVPTMVAVSLGDPEAQRFASGKAIIRRGDNLWTIARRVYGEGLKYTTIYQANTGQIRDPDRIYPGQVFDLPEGISGQ